MAKSQNKNELGLTLVEIVVAMAVALLLMTAFGQMITSKMRAVHSAKETGELRDIRAMLKRQLNCPATLAAGNCNSVADAEVRGIGCGGSDLINLPTNVTKMGLTELKVKCGTDIGANRLLVEYRNLTSNNQWRDLNRGIPWTCAPAAAPAGVTLTTTEFTASHACSIGNDGDVYCWGTNMLGVLGNITVNVALPSPYVNTSSTVSTCPVKVQGLIAPVSSIKLGRGTSCARDAVGWKCWGAINNGFPYQKYFPNDLVSNGVNITSYFSEIERTAVPVYTSLSSPPSQFTLDAPASPCAVVAGRVWCWGPGSNSQILPGPTGFSVQPTAVLGIDGSSLIATYVQGSPYNGCAIVNGGVMCWEAIGSHTGAISSGPETASFVPGLEAGSGVTQLSGKCALKNGDVKCWGTDFNGNAMPGLFDLPNLLGPVSNIQGGRMTIGMGALIGCALQAGAVKCSGAFLGGHYSSPTYGQMNVVPGLESGVTNLKCGGGRCCAEVTNHGQICFGRGGGEAFSFHMSNMPSAPLDFSACPGFSSGGSSPTTPPPAATCGN
jgi:hypothetical protein